MSKVIDKEYLLQQLKGYDSNIAEEKYLKKEDESIKSVKVNGSALTPDSTKAVDVDIPITEVQVNGVALTPSERAVNVVIPASTQYKIVEAETADTGYLKTYKLQANTGASGAYVDVSGAANINIPKDFLVKSATLETVATADSPVAGYAVGDKYIDFVINTKDTAEGSAVDSHIYLNVKDLFNPYTNGNGIELTGNAFSAKAANGIEVTSSGIGVKLASNSGLIVDTNGLKVDFESTDIDFTTEWSA